MKYKLDNLIDFTYYLMFILSALILLLVFLGFIPPLSLLAMVSCNLIMWICVLNWDLTKHAERR